MSVEKRKQLIIDKLTETSINNNGYIVINDILNCVDIEFPIEEIDKLCEDLFSRGIIIKSGTNDCELCDCEDIVHCYSRNRTNYDYRIPIVILSKNYIVLNKVSMEKLNTGNIELAYSYDTNMIRLIASNNGLNIKNTRLFAKGFFNHFKITNKGKYIADYNQDEKALYVDLNKNPKR